jgi:hypothetical protein
MWDSEDNTFEVIPLPHKPAEEVFNLIQAEDRKKKRLDLSAFVSDVDAARIEMTSVEQVIAEVREMPNVEPAVVSKVEELLMNRDN